MIRPPPRDHRLARLLARVAPITVLAVVSATSAVEGASADRSVLEPAAPRADCETTIPSPLVQAEELIVDRYQLGPHAAVEIPFPPSWSEDPHGDRNWRSRFHGFEWLLSLVKATTVTGEARYLERALELARSWLEGNPREAPPSDFSWTGQTTALRGQALECLARAAPGLEWLEDGLRLHGMALADPGFYRGRGNPALNQSIGLLQIGCHLGRDGWIDLASDRIDALLRRSIDRHGVVNEQAIGYQVYNYERYSVARTALAACGRPGPARFGRVRRIATYLGHATQPDGRYPLIGDTQDARAVIIPGTIAEFAATAGRRGPRPDREIAIYDRGYIYGRTGWGETRRFEDEVFFTMRFGDGREIHGHDDQGSLTLFGFGSRLLLDAGLYAYESDRWRTHMVSRAAHNAVVVVGRKSDWDRPTRLVRTSLDRRRFEAVLDVRAYGRISHQRRVVFSRRLGYMLVEDRLEARGRRRERFVQLWHLRDGSRPNVQGSSVRTRRARGNVVIRQLAPVGSTRIVSGRERPIQGWVSYRYRLLRPAPVVETRIRGRKARFVTLLVPVPRAGTRVRVNDVDMTPAGVTATITVGRVRERIVMTKGSARIMPAR